MIPAIWTLCLWIMDVLSHESAVRPTSTPVYALVLKGLSQLTRNIFLASQAHREIIVATMLKHVFASTDVFTSIGASSSSFRMIDKKFSSSIRLPSSNSYSHRYEMELKADISSRIIIEIMKVYPDIGCQVFNAFLNHLNPDSNGMIALPQLHVLTRIVACIVGAISRSPQIESTLLIIIQKYLSTAFLPTGTQSLVAILFQNKKVLKNFPIISICIFVN